MNTDEMRQLVAPLPPRRPVLRYHGGKWKLAPWLLAFFPPHRVYVEPFGGAASVLMRKPRSYGEVYNDLEDEVVNLFRVLRSPRQAGQLRRAIELTPFARSEFLRTYRVAPRGAVERARVLLIRSFMGFGSASMTRTHRTGFRSNSNRSGTTPAHDWVNWPSQVPALVERLQGVVIEHRDFADVVEQHDGIDTLHYVDPPYVYSSRAMPRGARHPHCYKHELDDVGHQRLAELLHSIKGFVVLSGYPSALYEELYHDWERHQCAAHADGARDRTEVVWLNPACVAALAGSREQMVAL